MHSPANCMDYYAHMPQRRAAIEAPAAHKSQVLTTTRFGTAWRWPDVSEGPLPIDDDDGGCDCDTDYAVDTQVWTQQSPAIEIHASDVLTDSADEALNVLSQRRVRCVLICGVHLNMCVLGRGYGIRQLLRCGFDVRLIRDLTDTMYSGRVMPHISHFGGTARMVRHVEARLCPSILSTDLTAQPPFCFRDAARTDGDGGDGGGGDGGGDGDGGGGGDGAHRTASVDDADAQTRHSCWARQSATAADGGAARRPADSELVAVIFRLLNAMPPRNGGGERRCPQHEGASEAPGDVGGGSDCAGAGAVPKVPRAAQRVLDIGCGEGIETRALLDRRRGLAATALDSTAIAAAALAKTAAALAQLQALGVDVVDATLPSLLPLEDGAFDVAFARLSLHYFAADVLRAQILPELRRVLRIGGALAVVVKMADGVPGAFTRACGDRKVRLSTDCWHRLLDEGGLSLELSRAMMAGATVDQWTTAGAPWLFVARATRIAHPSSDRAPEG